MSKFSQNNSPILSLKAKRKIKGVIPIKYLENLEESFTLLEEKPEPELKKVNPRLNKLK